LRKTLIVALAALVALAVSAVAIAQTPGADLTVTAKADKKPLNKKKKKVKAVAIGLDLKNEDSSQTADGIKVFMAKQIKPSTTGLKVCKQAVLEASAGEDCPAGSRIGGGSADAIAGVNTDHPANLTFDIDAFVIGKQKLGFYLQQQGGDIRVLSIGSFKKASGKYGSVLDIDIPQLAREFPPGTYNGLVGLNTTLYKKAGKNALFKRTSCPKNKTLPFNLTIHFQNNPNPPKMQEVEASDTAPC
jgi:hypothetical protein